MSVERVFVYGTLRKGGSNHFRMSGSESLGRGKIRGRMHRIDWYPALSLGGESRVVGEVYGVSIEHLRALDAFEGITEDAEEPREYRRVRTSVEMDEGTLSEAWVWEWAGSLEAAEFLNGEDWLEFEPNPG